MTKEPGTEQPESPNPKGHPLLAKIKQETEKSVPPKLKDSYASILVSGQKILWETAHRTVQQLAQRLRGPENVPPAIALGVTGVLKTVFEKSGIQGDERINQFVLASVLAAQVLMADLLEYVSQKKGVSITPELIAATTQATTQTLFQLFGIDEAKVKPLFDRAAQTGQQPQKPGAEPEPTQPATEVA